MNSWVKIISYYCLYIPILAVLFLIQSCMPDPLEVNHMPEVEPEIVVVSQILPDNSLIVLLTKTFSALEANINTAPEKLLEKIAVDDAIVTIQGNSAIDTLQLLGNGFYGGIDIPFQAGETYTLNVKSESMGEVHAQTTVLPKVDFKKIEVEQSFNPFGDTITQIIYAFSDPSDANWYLFNIQKIDPDKFIENAINPRAYTRILEDTPFNGQLYIEKVSVSSGFLPGDTIAVQLSNISKDYYEFVKLRMDNRYSFVEFLGEPINYPSNIAGGKGFFNLYIPDIKTFILED